MIEDALFEKAKAAARAEHERWTTGYDSRRQKGERAFVLRDGGGEFAGHAVYDEIGAFATERDADEACKEEALAAIVREVMRVVQEAGAV